MTTTENITTDTDIVHDGLSSLTDETIAYLADWWLEN